MTKEGLGVVSNGKIRQVISWSRPPHHTSELNYTIKYELTDRENPSQSSVMIITSKSKSVMLKLPTRNRPRRPLMYYVSVAAVSDAGQGQFSNKIVLAYKGKNQCLSTDPHFTYIVNNISSEMTCKKHKLTQMQL